MLKKCLTFIYKYGLIVKHTKTRAKLLAKSEQKGLKN